MGNIREYIDEQLKQLNKEQINDEIRHSLIQRTKKSIEKNFRRHPELEKSIDIKPLSVLSHDEIADFIEENWFLYYGYETRIIFTQERIRSDFAGKDGLCFFQNGELIALTMNKKLKSVKLFTGLVVSYSKRGFGIGKMIYFSHVILNLNLYLYWLDSRFKGKKGSSYELFSNEETVFEVPYFSKILDARETIKVEKIKNPFIRLMANYSHLKGINSKKIGTEKNMSGLSKTQDPEQIETIKNELEAGKTGEIYFSNKNEKETMNDVFKCDGNTVALVSGFKNPRYVDGKIDECASGVMYVDSLYFKTQKKGIKKEVIREIIRRGKQMNCYSLFLTKTSTNLTNSELYQFGFVKSGSQALVLLPISEAGKRKSKTADLTSIICFLR